MVLLFYTTYISVDLAHREIFRAKVGKGGIKSCNLPLSCSFRGGTAHGSAYYGGGSGTIWMDDVQCTGEECSLAQCRFYGWGHEDCSHSEDVAVKCSPANGMYREFGNFRENLIFANSTKRHISDVKKRD